MTTISIDPNLLTAAIKALNITAPVYCATYINDGQNMRLAITTRDGVCYWSPGASAPSLPNPVPQPADDLTLIPQIGAATETILNQHGIFTFEDLTNSDTALLLSIMPRRALRCVVLYIQTNCPELPFAWKPYKE